MKVAITGTTPNCPNFGRVCANGKAVKGLETGWQIPISFKVRHVKGCHLDGGNPHWVTPALDGRPGPGAEKGQPVSPLCPF